MRYRFYFFLFFILLSFWAYQTSSFAEILDIASFYKSGVNSLDQKFDISKYRAFKQLDDVSGPDKMGVYEKALRKKAWTSEEQLQKKFGLWLQFALPGLYPSYVAFNPYLNGQFRRHEKTVHTEGEEGFRINAFENSKIAHFLKTNLTEKGMPLSYSVPQGYWQTYKPMMGPVDSVLERILVENGLSIYDGALWQIALTVDGDPKYRKSVYGYTQTLKNGRLGELDDLRAYGPTFKYGAKKTQVKKANGFFFRIISDKYIQRDPVLGDIKISGFPNFELPHHEDWKPVMGEQAWAAIIGPLQTAYFRYNRESLFFSDEVTLALSILPTLELMQSEIGGIYHVPFGTKGKSADDISNENNFSMHAALKMLRDTVQKYDAKKAEKIQRLIDGQENYFRKYAFDRKAGVFYQGGLYTDSRFRPTEIFAVDCQTWGVLSLGTEWIDANFGEGTAYRLWQKTKERAGYFDEKGIFRGVGFTDGQRVLSIEWTCGAILAAREMAKSYETSHPERTQTLKEDIVCMRNGIEKFHTVLPNRSKAYLYANKRYFIPFGWWANPLPSMASSAWVLLIDSGFNPFILGGGKDFRNEETIEKFYEPILPKPAALPAAVMTEKKKEPAKAGKTPAAKRSALRRYSRKAFVPSAEPSLEIDVNRKMQHDIEEMPKSRFNNRFRH